MDIDLENGGGGGGGNNDVHDDAAVVSSSPDPDDPRAIEKQPFTLLRSAPYLVTMLAGVVLFAVGLALTGPPSCWPGADLTGNTGCNALPFAIGHVGLVMALFAAMFASTEFSCCAPRLDQADDDDH